MAVGLGFVQGSAMEEVRLDGEGEEEVGGFGDEAGEESDGGDGEVVFESQYCRDRQICYAERVEVFEYILLHVHLLLHRKYFYVVFIVFPVEIVTEFTIVGSGMLIYGL